MIERILAALFGWWIVGALLRRLLTLAATAVALVLIISYLMNPQDPLRYAETVWQAAKGPLAALAVLALQVARAAVELMKSLLKGVLP
jgi:hypothetical protein